MTHRFGLAIASLALVASIASAGISFGTANKDHLPVGPWYLYWPLEGHFQVPAVPQYPYWTAPQTLPVVPPAPYNLMPQFSGQQQSALPQGGLPYGYGQVPQGYGFNPAAAAQGGYPQAQVPQSQGARGPVQQQPGALPTFNGMPGTYPTGVPYPNMPAYPPAFGQQPNR